VAGSLGAGSYLGVARLLHVQEVTAISGAVLRRRS
jgi:hypothetical protein